MLINRLFYLFEQYFGEKVTKSSLFEYLILDCIKYIYFDCFEFLVEEKNLLAYNSQIYKKVLKMVLLQSKKIKKTFQILSKSYAVTPSN
ncbi:TPA: hypothetical protein ACNHS6_002579 [Enterococcus faecalis]